MLLFHEIAKQSTTARNDWVVSTQQCPLAMTFTYTALYIPYSIL
ncbi:hypothetical protein RAMDARK_1101 [Rickettsia amblyommatis str. Darkwater]|nr:hypothetical protein RAMDARK_1101 [Rickettsia amblyommatis str. Darkwater]